MRLIEFYTRQIPYDPSSIPTENHKMKALNVCLLVLISLFSTVTFSSTVDNQTDNQNLVVESERNDFLANNTYEGSSFINELVAKSSDVSFAKYCCKTCKKGKACGDSCISKTKVCYKAEGCACNGIWIR